MRLDGLIFDLDGTLVDNLAGDCEAFIRAFAEHGHRGFTPADIVGMFGASSEGIIRGVVGDSWEGCWEAYCQYYESSLTELGPVPGVVELLDWARVAGLRTGLVTGGSERMARMTLRAVGLDRFGPSARFGSTGGSIKRQCIDEVLAEASGAAQGRVPRRCGAGHGDRQGRRARRHWGSVVRDHGR